MLIGCFFLLILLHPLFAEKMALRPEPQVVNKAVANQSVHSNLLFSEEVKHQLVSRKMLYFWMIILSISIQQPAFLLYEVNLYRVILYFWAINNISK